MMQENQPEEDDYLEVDEMSGLEAYFQTDEKSGMRFLVLIDHTDNVVIPVDKIPRLFKYVKARL